MTPLTSGLEEWRNKSAEKWGQGEIRHGHISVLGTGLSLHLPFFPLISTDGTFCLVSPHTSFLLAASAAAS
jgi:hypothetical protein